MRIRAFLTSQLNFPGLLILLAITSASAEDGLRSSYYKNGEIHVNVLGQAGADAHHDRPLGL